MQASDLTVEVRDRDLKRIGQIRPEDLDLSVTDQFRNVGNWSLTLPSEHPMADPLNTPGFGIVISDGVGSEFFSGPTVRPSRQATPMDIAGTLTVQGVSDSIILADMLAWPTPSSDTMAGQVDAHDVREAVAETLLHQYVRVNVGPDAPVSRRNPRLVMGADGARGPIKKKSARFPVLGSLLSEIAASAGLGFRVVDRGGILVFETFEVVDRSSEIRLDIENGTLAGHSVAFSAPGATHVIVAGQGTGVDRAFLLASTPESIAASEEWGRRIEHWVDQRQTDDPNEYQQRADEILSEQGFTGVEVKIVPLDDQDGRNRFGVDWNLGDIITVVVDDVETKDVVSGYKLRSASDGFSVGAIIGFGGESSSASVTSRVAALEANTEQGVTSDQFQTLANGEPWQDASLSGAWVEYSTTFAPPSLRRVAGNEVVLRGMVKGGSVGSVLTLPPGYRPEFYEIFSVPASAPGWTPPERAVRIEVRPDGTVALPNLGANTGATGPWFWLSLSGIRFQAAA